MFKNYKDLLFAYFECEVEKALSHFYGFYKGNTKSKRALFFRV